jgi:uncharacterized DUF497 family protein
MQFEFDPSKRQDTLDQRGLDMANAAEVFEDDHLTVEDDRFDYGETRYVTIGYMAGRMVVLVWTRRDNACRIISMRKANDREQKA